MNIYTLGYEKRNITEYVDILIGKKIKLVIDVRETPWSHKKHFCKNAFYEELSKNNIQYVHVKELGNPKSFRKSDLSPNEILKLYKNYLLKTNMGVDMFMDLFNNAKNEGINICLTCFEREHTCCHRSIITDHISKNVTARVVHL